MRTITILISATILVLVSSTFRAGPTAAAQKQATFKVAYYNIQSGMGTASLSGTWSERHDAGGARAGVRRCPSDHAGIVVEYAWRQAPFRCTAGPVHNRHRAV